MNITQAIYDGLTKIAYEIKTSRENHEIDLLKGYMTDEDKLRLLKYDLYSETRANVRPEHVAELRKTISLLSNEIERKHDRENSLITILNEGARTFFGLGMLAVAASYAVQWSGACNHVNSAFCRNSRAIPFAVERYFFNEPSLVNPEPNVNIDQN